MPHTTNPNQAGERTPVMRNQILLNPESGNLPQWAEQEAERLSKLSTFQPYKSTAVGRASVYRRLNATLRAAGIHGNFRETVARDICDMARLKGGVK